MYSRSLLNIIRKHEVIRMLGIIKFQNKPLTGEDFKPEKPAFYVRYNAESKQYEIVK